MDSQYQTECLTGAVRLLQGTDPCTWTPALDRLEAAGIDTGLRRADNRENRLALLWAAKRALERLASEEE